MPTSSFDTLARTLATGSSRRSLLRGMVGAAVGGALAGRNAVAAPQSKVGICHRDDLGQYRYQEVNGNAVPAHEAHGDAISPNFSSDPNHCGGCGISCGDTATCQAGVCVEVTAPPPTVCTAAVLASADGVDDDFLVDDDLAVYVNGGLAGSGNLFTDPISLGSLTNGDTLRVVASNTTNPTFCTQGYEHLDAITLYCLDNGSTQSINPSDIAGLPAGGCGHVFYDQTFTVAL